MYPSFNTSHIRLYYKQTHQQLVIHHVFIILLQSCRKCLSRFVEDNKTQVLFSPTVYIRRLIKEQYCHFAPPSSWRSGTPLSCPPFRPATAQKKILIVYIVLKKNALGFETAVTVWLQLYLQKQPFGAVLQNGCSSK